MCVYAKIGEEPPSDHRARTTAHATVTSPPPTPDTARQLISMVDLSQGCAWWLRKGVCRNPSDGRAARAIDCPSLGSAVGTSKTVGGY